MGEETNAGRLKERDRIAQPKRKLGNNIKVVLKKWKWKGWPLFFWLLKNVAGKYINDLKF